MNKKIIIFILIAIIFIVLMGVLIYKVSNNDKPSTMAENAENEITIKSTSKNPIEKNEVEAEIIHIKSSGNGLEVKATVKNKSKETINGLYIEIELLDSAGNSVAVITENRQEPIEANKSIEVTCYVVGETKLQDISNAKIITVEKNSIGETIDQSIQDMVPEELEQ